MKRFHVERFEANWFRLFVGALGAAIVMIAGTARAQFSADYQTNVIDGVVSNWAGDYYVGSNYVFDALQIINGGAVYNGSTGYIGYSSTANNNSVLVSGTGSVWSNWSNWGSYGSSFYVGYQGSGNSLVITNGGTVYNAQWLNSASYIGYSSTANKNSVQVSGSGSVWNQWSGLYVGYQGSGNSLAINNGGKVLSGAGSIGGYGSNNSVMVSGSGSVWNQWSGLYVGYQGSGNSLVITNGGAVYNSPGYEIGYIGYSSTANNNSVLVSGSGSLWNHWSDWEGTATVYVGYQGSGNSLVINNGGKVLSGAGYIGGYGSNNSVMVAGSGSVWSIQQGVVYSALLPLYVGYQGSGNSLVITNGGAVYNGAPGYIGYSSTANNNSVLVSGSGSLWSSGNGLYVGYQGSGNSLVITNGGAVISYEGSIGYSGSNNSVLVSGSGSVWSNWYGGVEVGHQGSGNSLVINNGGAVVDYGYSGVTSYIGPSGSNNSVVVSGSGSVWDNRFGGLYLGRSGGSGNSLVISNDGTVINAQCFIGYSFGNANSVLVTDSGSVWSNRSYLCLGENSSGNSLVISNGGAVISNRGLIGLPTYGSSGSNNSVVVSGSGSVWDDRFGYLYIGCGGSGNSLVITNGGAVISYDGFIGFSGNGISGSNNSVLVTGSGSLWSNQYGLYVGDSGSSGNSLLVNNGGMAVASNIVVAPNNIVSLNGGNLIMADSLVISNNAVLKGSGMIQANLILAGTLSPGAITNFGNLSLQPGAVLDFTLGGTIQGTEYGFILVTNGVAALDGLLQVSFINGFETNVLNSDIFTLLTTTNVLTGSFTNVLSGERLMTVGGEGSFLVSYSDNNLVLSDYQVVPEPGTLALCVLGLLALFAVRRQNRLGRYCTATTAVSTARAVCTKR
jgi:T5SS/PEP-CTERM-associated repeat protein